MDRLIYTAMTGAKQTLEMQANVSNNLANVATNGFRAELNTFRSVPIVSDGLPTRAFVVNATVGSDFTGGPIQQTGRALDVAIQGDGWLAVETSNGSEAYTRSGSLKIDATGVLQTTAGLNLVGETGPITIPPDVNVAIAADGTVSSIPNTGVPNAVNILGRIKMVNPDPATLKRGDDGLFRVDGPDPADSDPNVTLASGALEGSNVNTVEAMVNMINLSRQFEMNMKALSTAESDAAKATQLLSLS
ncbi:flagellar basal-body rod protein FlgF [Herbaspirillum sp. RTI4]|uniref:flagellar basal-body rod protein FlgF n=1 Tax=Herbaspirillum sp. RTI4 TaxID=3048640 RepID=UPI002AB33CE3|nr:flagellar basal-body rod protein FlgF [Herbaspirillum sp. RTI4]MDY7578300.1 flagellar basal-body rod protein FlgF [Herbaspirillum sp. RTI4]MEA9981207.1 flagellar basal-body rod protein FlgF [Herbaspirillum sp. RTI4]